MPTALMTNPPGIRRNPLMALVGNPPKDRTMAKAKKSQKKRSAAKARRTAPKKAAPVAPAARVPRRKAKRKASRPNAVAVVKDPAGGLKTVKLNPRRQVGRGRGRGVLRNPMAGAAGILGDLKALPGELASLATPAGMLWAGAGAGTSAVLGAVVAPYIANMVPVSSPMAARIANGTTYALAGTVPALFIKDPSKRRKFLLGVIGMAASEFLFPGWSADVARKVPVVGKWIPTPAVPKALNDDMLATMPGASLAGFARRPVGGFFAKSSASKSAPAVRKATGPLKDDLTALAADLRLPPVDPMKDRSGALAGLSVDPLKDRPGALAGLPLGAL